MLVAVHGVALVLEVLDDAALRTPAAHTTATPHEHRCGPQHRVPYTVHRTNMCREKPTRKAVSSLHCTATAAIRYTSARRYSRGSHFDADVA